MYMTFIMIIIFSLVILFGAIIAKSIFKQNINLSNFLKTIALSIIISMAMEFAYISILRNLHKIQQLYTAPILTILIFIFIFIVTLSRK